MADVLLNPYLAYRNQAKEAMEFYKGVFGGELTLSTFGEGMPDAPDDKKDLIMHAKLEAPDLTLMASDAMQNDTVVESMAVSLSLSGTDEAKLKGFFEGLSAGGKVTQPLEKQSWGDQFGMLVDKYGINWMVNIGSNG